MSGLEGLFWSIVGLMLLTYLVYPACVGAIGVSPARRRREAMKSSPSVSIVIVAHNEAAHIAGKLLSIQQTEYEGQVEVLVADDGSSDETAVLARAADMPARRVHVFTYERGGKAAALNRVVAEAKGEILAFTDADPKWSPSTLRELVRPFAAARIGAVAGHVATAKAGRKHEAAERGFRSYENLIRRGEDRLFGCVSADGGLYAIRRHLFEPVPLGVTDDFFISTAAVAKGHRIAFAPRAIATEESIDSESRHFRRRVRITVRGLTGLWMRRGLLNPFKTGFYAFGLLFHKGLRRVAPALLVLLLPLSLVLWPRGPVYQAALVLQLIGMGVGCLPILVPRNWPKFVLVPHLLINHLSGLAWGCVLFCAGVRYTQWTPQKAEAARSGPAP